MKYYYVPQSYSVSIATSGIDPPCRSGKFSSSSFTPKLPLILCARRMRDRTARGTNLLFHCYPDFFLLCLLKLAHLGDSAFC